MGISKELLKILACPECKSELKTSKQQFICTKCNKKYKIKNEIPILI